MAEATLFPDSVPVKRIRRQRVQKLPSVSRWKYVSSGSWRRGKRNKHFNEPSPPLNTPGEPPVIIPVYESRPPQFPRYAVTQDGIVYSLGDRRCKIAQRHGPNGHMAVSLCINGKYITRYVHRLMAEAFNLRKPPGATIIRHLDGNPENNQLENLAWGTPKQNIRDSMRHGTFMLRQYRKFKLKPEEVAQIKRRLRNGESQTVLAKEFGVTSTNIGNIKRGIVWRHVPIAPG